MKNQGIKLVKEFYEETAKDYDKQYETPYWELYREITWDNIKKFLPERKNAIILDAGGGTGYWAIKLAKVGYRVVLTDIAKNMLRVAERKIRKEKIENKVEIREVDIGDMSCFHSNYFDMVLAQGDPISYCLNARKAVKELVRVVKPNAHLIVSVDNRYPIIPKLIEDNSFDGVLNFLKTGILERRFKFQAFTPEELKKLFETCGLKVVGIIGKPVLVQLIPREKINKILGNRIIFRKILNLELKFCDTPSLVGIGGHLEIVGVKQKKRTKHATHSRIHKTINSISLLDP